MSSIVVFGFQAFVIRPPEARGVPAELFLAEGFEEAAMGAALTLANARRRMEVLDMAKVWCELFRELYVV